MNNTNGKGASALNVEALTLRRGDFKILHSANLQLGDGEWGILSGETGAGKTSLFLALAGLIAVDSGSIRVNGTMVESDGIHVAPHRRGIGLVFQDLALWPHLNAKNHLLFALGECKMTRAEKRERARGLLAEFGLSELAGRKPHQLSGGQGQALAIARALAPSPRLLLLDEPLAHLDPERRRECISILRKVRESGDCSVLIASHHPEEAAELADRRFHLREGVFTELD
jgi:iron(III) transport system ATP-binding protein